MSVIGKQMWGAAVAAMVLVGCAGETLDQGPATSGQYVEQLEGYGQVVRVTADDRFAAELRPAGEVEASVPEGYSADDFIEVAEGVYLLRDLVESKQVIFHSTEAPRNLGHLIPQKGAPSQALKPQKTLHREGPERDDRECGTREETCTVCNFEGYDVDFGTVDFLADGVQFGWSDVVLAGHFSSDCCEGFSYTDVFVSLESFGDVPAQLSASAEIYINGSFVGYVAAASIGTYLASAVYLSVLGISCEDELLVEVFTARGFSYEGAAAFIYKSMDVTFDCDECQEVPEICE